MASLLAPIPWRRLASSTVWAIAAYAAIPAGWAVADVCAAPGGKAAELARTASVIYAGDRSAARLRRVITNVGRLGLTHVLPYVGDARTPPFEGVDAVTSRVIRDLLAGFVARGSTVFLTSHVLEIVERLCTHVGIIVRGELVEQGSLESIRRSGSLEECFLEKVGADPEATRKLNWLEEAAP